MQVLTTASSSLSIFDDSRGDIDRPRQKARRPAARFIVSRVVVRRLVLARMALVTTDAVPFLGASLLIARRDIAPASGSRSGSDDDFVDPNFFDDDYSVAATTGVCRVWEGAAVLVRHLGECEALRARLRGRRVLELGAGVGSVRPRGGRRGSPRPPHGPPRGRRRGALGKRAKESTRRRRSRRRSRRRRRGRTPRRSPRRRHLAPPRRPPPPRPPHPPGPARPFRSSAPGAEPPPRRPSTGPSPSQYSWNPNLDRPRRPARADAERAAGGDAAAEAFWRRSGGPPRDPRRAEILLAAECVWLRELVEPFAETCAALMRPRGDAEACVLAFRDRSSARE